MKNLKNKKYSTKKNSSGVQSTKLLQTLQKAITTKEASVSYVFVEERIQNIHSNDLDKMQTVEKTSMLHVNLTPEALDKTPNEIIKMLETTKNDLGAKYFILS